MTFGKRLKELRHQKKLTLKNLADRIGSSKGYLSGIEHGKVNPPSDRFVRRMAKTLGVAETELLRLAYYDKVPKEVKTEFRSLSGTEGSGRTPGLIPLLNSAATGYPVEVGEQGLPRPLVVEFVRVPGLQYARAFAVTVCGGDMVGPEGKGFRPGDLVIATPEGGIQSGDIVFVVFNLNEGKVAHLRRISFENRDQILLQPLNAESPMHALTRDDIDGLYRVVARIEYLGHARTSAVGGKSRT